MLVRRRFCGIRCNLRHRKIEGIKTSQDFNALAQVVWFLQRRICFQSLDQALQGLYHR